MRICVTTMIYPYYYNRTDDNRLYHILYTLSMYKETGQYALRDSAAVCIYIYNNIYITIILLLCIRTQRAMRIVRYRM